MRPIEVDFHWSDGHLDVTKKLTFDLNYETTVEVAVTLDGKPEPVAVAWRGGFGDKAVYNAAQLVTVFYKTGGKLNLLQYKKLGVSGNQSQPAVQYGPLEFAGIEDQFFTAAFLPDGTDISLWHWMQNHTVTGGRQTDHRAGSGDGGGDDGGRAVARARVRGAERLAAAGRAAAVAGGAGEFWMDRNHREAAAVDFADAAHQSAELGLVHRADDAGDQPRDVSAEDEELAFDAEDAESGAGNPADSGSLQEIFDERSAQEKNERRSDGGVQPRRHQPDGQLPADGVSDADLVGAVARAERSDRIAPRAVDGLDSRPFGDGPVLYFADRHDHHDVPDDENDAADDGGSGAAENDGVDAADDGIYFLPAFERIEFVYVHEQSGGNRPAVLSE